MNHQPGPVERRQLARRVLDQPAVAQLLSRAGQVMALAVVLDASEKGLGLVVSTPPDPQAIHAIELGTPRTGWLLRLVASVAYLCPESDGLLRIGVVLGDHLSTEDLARLGA